MLKLAQGSSRPIIITLGIVIIVFILSNIYPHNILNIIRWPVLYIFFIIVWFFRDPERKIPSGKNNILSPADGRVVKITNQKGRTKIAIFMSLFNVHVNRIPIRGKIISKKHIQGKYQPAFKPNIHMTNEQSEILIQNQSIEVKVTQIAGLLARKIINNLVPDTEVIAGQRYGMIRFGSRVDIEFPLICKVQCRKGQKVKAGETILAKIVKDA